MNATLPNSPAPPTPAPEANPPQDAPKSVPQIAWPHVLLGLLGVGISLYSVHLHNLVKAGGDACGATATINCNAVLGSRWAVIAGVPLGYYGALFFAIVIITAISTLPPDTARRQIALPRLVIASGGLIGSIALTWISVVGIGSLCKVCLATHSVTLTNFLVASWGFWQATKADRKLL